MLKLIIDPDDLRTLLLKGFEIIGALIVGAKSTDFQGIASEGIAASLKLRKTLSGSSTSLDYNRDLIGAVVDPSAGDVQFFVSCSRNSGRLESANSVVYDDEPDKYVWERGCLLKCELPIRLPVYYPANSPKGAMIFSSSRFTSMFLYLLHCRVFLYGVKGMFFWLKHY